MKHLFSLALLAPLLLAAQNLVPNGSFRLGTDGFALRNHLRFDTNPGMKFFSLEIAEDASEKKKVLKIHNPCADRFTLHCCQFRLKENRDYIIRLRARTTAKGGQKTVFHLYSISNKWSGWFFSPELTEEWKTIELKFKTGPKDGAPFFYHFQFRNASDSQIPASDIFISSLEIFESGTLPISGVELALSAKQVLCIADEKADVPLILKAGNFTEKPWNGTVKVKAEEDLLASKNTEQTIKVTLAPGEIREIPLNFTLQYGAYQFTANAEGVNTSIPAVIAVIGKYTRSKLDLSRDFCFSINGGLNITQTTVVPHLSTTAYNTEPEMMLE